MVTKPKIYYVVMKQTAGGIIATDAVFVQVRAARKYLSGKNLGAINTAKMLGLEKVTEFYYLEKCLPGES
ncbi:hypothetical protein [Lacticaseibacillus rhamnosus]|uniref:hypothetical protein n=1 Tax=Lacticaseibacillus rhamnosus TaxID=47715 RepID=UPI00237F8892|nr:hypothetical protein [Lacticaseibacillus rhamnosus]MDE3295892.1 hypothetical protein [Lacticaseibacillus rhamnosus]